VHLNCTVHWAQSTPSQASALSTQCTTNLEHSHALSTQCRLTWQALALSATDLLGIKVQVRASCVVLVRSVDFACFLGPEIVCCLCCFVFLTQGSKIKNKASSNSVILESFPELFAFILCLCIHICKSINFSCETWPSKTQTYVSTRTKQI